MATVYAGWTKDDPVIISARQVAFQQCLAECRSMTDQLAKRSPERFTAARAEVKKNLWDLDNVRKILRRELAALDEAERGPLAETEVFQNWQAACADVDFLVDERRPETAAALAIEDYATAQLMNALEGVTK